MSCQQQSWSKRSKRGKKKSLEHDFLKKSHALETHFDHFGRGEWGVVRGLFYTPMLRSMVDGTADCSAVLLVYPIVVRMRWMVTSDTTCRDTRCLENYCGTSEPDVPNPFYPFVWGEISMSCWLRHPWLLIFLLGMHCMHTPRLSFSWNISGKPCFRRGMFESVATHGGIFET